MIVFPPAPNDANELLSVSPVVPMSLRITNMTNANPMVVTVTVDSNQVNQYVTGQKIVFTIPPPYGIIEADNQVGTITNVDGNNLTVNINSTEYSAFVTPVDYQQQPASIAPYGSANIYNVTTVPYHALDGQTGN